MDNEPSVDIRRADDRFATDTPWLRSRHSFSFGSHYDPANTHHGLLLVNNDDVVAPATGFDTHRHQDMEIVTWVLEGSLLHQDSTGHSGVIHPGLAQRMSAGRGVLHSEKNDSGEPVHFVQMWVQPDESGVEPGYEQLDVSEALDNGDLVTVASGEHDAAGIRIHQRDAVMHVARLQPDKAITLPEASYVHLFVARGAVDLEASGRLDTGDAGRISGSGGQVVRAIDPAEIIVWEMKEDLGSRG